MEGLIMQKKAQFDEFNEYNSPERPGQLPTIEGRGLVEKERSSYQNFYNARA